MKDGDAVPIPVTESLLGCGTVCKRLDVSRDTLQRMCAKGRFPAPIKLETGSIRWLDSEVSAWIVRQAGRPRVVYKVDGARP